MMNKTVFTLAFALLCAGVFAQTSEQTINKAWKFSLGDASSMQKDFTHGTEYFTYFAKVKSANHSHSPIVEDFDDSGWRNVTLPHDWVVDLPYSSEASHSHGYKCIGWKYPESSVGWYRRHLFVPEEDKGKQFFIELESVYRDYEIFCNGMYLGHEKSGYATRIFKLTPYLNYGGDNVITVRANASVEEGWYYEGAGIYGNVKLHKTGPVAVDLFSLRINSTPGESCGKVDFDYVFANEDTKPEKASRQIRILDASGKEVSKPERLWSLEDPYLYTAEISVFYEGELSAKYLRKFGVRSIEFSNEKGFLLNGKAVKFKGGNLHLDHAGAGTAVPSKLWEYRVRQLKKYGFNAIRSSHNPAAPAMLDVCDSLGMLVIDENRQFGVNEEQLKGLQNMIERDINHPCIVLWSIGNEEWSVEWNEKGTLIAGEKCGKVRELDPSRPATYGNAGGRELVKGVDIFGYNYIVQNPIDEYYAKYPSHGAIGTEETSGAGTRGRYETVPEEGWMTPLNRRDTVGRINVIEHGWKFYKERPWAYGIFYWTAQDYRGEPNPMLWPATGSQFGILDYCSYPKDEAYYLKAVWTTEPSVHICGPCEGKVWVYSNCEQVILYADGKSLGKKKMPLDGHLEWEAGKHKEFRAVGYNRGRKVARDIYPEKVLKSSYTLSSQSLKADGEDLVVIDVLTPSDQAMEVRVENACFLGWGNGNPGFKETERPLEGNALSVKPFAGRLQILVRSTENAKGRAIVHLGSETLSIDYQ